MEKENDKEVGFPPNQHMKMCRDTSGKNNAFDEHARAVWY